MALPALRQSPIIRIALTHLVSKSRQTIVAMLGVMFGITVFIFQAGLITGLQNYMIDKIVNNSPHIHLFNDPDADPPPILARTGDPASGRPPWYIVRHQKLPERDRKIRGAASIMSLLEADPRILGVAPLVTAQGILRAGFKEQPATVAGVDIEAENRLFNLSKDQIEGDFTQLVTRANGIILGVGVAGRLGARVGDLITLSTPVTTLDLLVVSITQTGITAIDDGRVYVPLRTAQRLLGQDRLYITDLNLKLANVDEADALSGEIHRMTGYRAQSWKEANAGIFGVFKIQNIATYLVITSILIVAGFGIFNILMMMIYEKMTDIAILKSMGYRSGDIMRLFMLEALAIGVAGGLLGLALGYLVSVAATKIQIQIKGLVTLDHLNINFDPLFYVSGFAFALIATALAGYIPARRAATIDPVEIIRGK